MDFYTSLDFGDDKTFTKDLLIEYFKWAEIDGEEGITKLFNIIHDWYKDDEFINSCLIDCILERVKKCIEEYGNFNMAKTYLNLLKNC